MLAFIDVTDEGIRDSDASESTSVSNSDSLASANSVLLDRVPVSIASLGVLAHGMDVASGRALIGRLRVAGASAASLWSAGGAMNLSNDGAS